MIKLNIVIYLLKFVFPLIIFLSLPLNSLYAFLHDDDQMKAPPSVIEGIAAGNPHDVIVLFDETATQDAISSMREYFGVSYDNQHIIETKKQYYDFIKKMVKDELPDNEFEVIKDYSHLPMMFIRLKTNNSLSILAKNPSVVRLYQNQQRKLFLEESLLLINQPQVASIGLSGKGTTVAILDTGADYTLPAFGSCSAPNSPPETCKVIHAQDFAFDDGQLDAHGHGTNVAGIVVGVAPDTRLAVLDVFDGQLAWDVDIISAINWCIANKSNLNIVAMNLSFGSGGYTSPCHSDSLSTPITEARSAGILSSIASGNDGFKNKISSPACIPSAISVGAVYDGNVGIKNWSVCVDFTTFADKVACFSNSASFLSILAPGSVINAAGRSMSGTSQAAPHISGAIAVLRGEGVFPFDTLDKTISRMTDTGMPVFDRRNGFTKPRIDLLSAIEAINTYSISGRVTTQSIFNRTGRPIRGVTMKLSGNAGALITTDNLGNYNFRGLTNSLYTITPSLTGYIFIPENIQVAITDSNITGVNFIGKKIKIEIRDRL